MYRIEYPSYESNGMKVLVYADYEVTFHLGARIDMTEDRTVFMARIYDAREWHNKHPSPQWKDIKPVSFSTPEEAMAYAEVTVKLWGGA